MGELQDYSERMMRHATGLVACDPGVQAAFDDGTVVGWWSDEDLMRAELGRYAPNDIDLNRNRVRPY